MSVLLLGVSHQSAPVSLLERLALDAEGTAKLIADVTECEHVSEAVVIATCNRLEVYSEVDRFHGSVEELSALLVDRADTTTQALLGHLYVHYDDAAVSHLFQVAAGLDSLAIGETQILGQTREALQLGQELGSVGPALNALFQQALRVGKRCQAETDIGRAAPSLVTAALDRALALTGSLTGRSAVVVGAGAMAALATATLSRLGVEDIAVANRSTEQGERLAADYGVRSVPLVDLDTVLGNADLVLSCTGAGGVLVTEAALRAARSGADHPTVVMDLALPHDVEPSVAELDGVELVSLTTLVESRDATPASEEVEGVRAIVAEEVTSFLAARRGASVTPTVVALRSMATSVVEDEMERLDGRLPGLDDASREEVRQTVRRVADKLLHQPTVRVKELADSGGAVSYAAALAELFSLDPEAVDAVTRPAVPEEQRPPDTSSPTDASARGDDA